MDHPDFRVGKRIFATLHPDLRWGVVMLTPAQQRAVVAGDPGTFVPAKGGWGRQGCTQVLLRRVKARALREAMSLAWANKAPSKRGRR